LSPCQNRLTRLTRLNLTRLNLTRLILEVDLTGW
jgi:hypothetical protein